MTALPEGNGPPALAAVSRDIRTTRAAGIAGLLFAVLFVGSVLLLRKHPAAGSSAEEIRAWYLQDSSKQVALVGLYLGLLSCRPFGDRRLSPFRGLMTWHHLTGLVTGVLALTWVASGLVSMNPWGFLESQDDPGAARLAGPPQAYADVQVALESAAARAPTVAQVKLAPFDGRVFLMAGDQRLDAAGGRTILFRTNRGRQTYSQPPRDNRGDYSA